MLRRRLLQDGTFGPFETVFPGDLSPEEQIELLGAQLAQEKLSGMQKDAIIASLGQQISLLKLEVMALKGGGQ